MDWRRVARYAAPPVEDAAAYLARLKRPLRAAGEPDMSLDSPLFRSMYEADRAYEQLAKGRTPNLRNAGGDLASIAGQAIRAENAAARAARNAPFLERALTNDPDGLLRYAGPLAAIGTTAAGGGIAIQNAMQERQQRDVEMAQSNALMAAAHAQRQRNAADSLAGQDATLRDMRAPELGPILGDDYDQELFDSIGRHAASVDAARAPGEAWSEPDILLPDGAPPPFDMQEADYDMRTLHEGFDPVATPIYGGDESLVFRDADQEQADYAAIAALAREQAEAIEREPGGWPSPEAMKRGVPRELALDDPNQDFEFGTMRPKTFEEQLFGPGVGPGAPPPPRGLQLPTRKPPSRNVKAPLMPRSSGAWQ